MSDQVGVRVTEQTHVAEARRTALGQLSGSWSEHDLGRVALLVTELAGNLVKHARQTGEMLLRPLGDYGLEALCLDRGPGMLSVVRCLEDGYSTVGSPGTGLGAALRLSDSFDVFSRQESGTAMVARLTRAGIRQEPGRFELGVVSLPKPGEAVCGDKWVTADLGSRTRVLMVDGLGHGDGAEQASAAAVAEFVRAPEGDLTDVLLRVHQVLVPTRGAAVGIAELDPAKRALSFVGLGNIAGVAICDDASRNLVSHSGTAGYRMHRAQTYQYPWPPGALLVLHSDGCASRWSLDTYPGLIARHPSLVAGVLYRDFCRGRDDVTVLAIRSLSKEQG
jgi:anti-sigma regulatory factor (Ser/Thr protein kinase)